MKLPISCLNLLFRSFTVLLALGALILMVIGPVSAANFPGMVTGSKTKKEIKIPQKMSPEDGRNLPGDAALHSIGCLVVRHSVKAKR